MHCAFAQAGRLFLAQLMAQETGGAGDGGGSNRRSKRQKLTTTAEATGEAARWVLREELPGRVRDAEVCSVSAAACL